MKLSTVNNVIHMMHIFYEVIKEHICMIVM